MKYCMIPLDSALSFLGFLDFSQKLLGDSTPAARRHIGCWFCSWFWYEPPGDDEHLPGDATLFAFFLGLCFAQGSLGLLIVILCMMLCVNSMKLLELGF